MAKQEIQGFCPSCGTSLYYTEGEAVMCPSCDKQVTPRANWEAERATESSFDAAMVVGLDNPESALVYLENYYENFDWEKFAETTDLVPAAINAMVEKNKIKNGASASSWLLSFKGLGIPVYKKLEGLNGLERKMAEKYNPKNNDEVLKLFDSYRRVVKALIDKKDEIVKRLESDVRYAERFGLDEAVAAQIKGELANIVKALEALKPVEKLAELPVYTAAKAQVDKKKAAEFFARGIDAEAVYKDAVARFEDPSASKVEAATLFESIRGYADAAEYVKKINKYFNFNYEFFDYMGKRFIFKEEKYTLEIGGGKKGGCALFGKKKKAEEAAAKAEAEANAKDCLSLYAIDEDGLPEEKPLIKGINKIIKCYSGRVYFYKNRDGVVYYDFATGETVVLDKGKDEDYLTAEGEYEAYVNIDGNGFCFKKRLPLKSEKTGCLKKKSKNVPHENNYSLVYVDMKTNSVKTFVEELVDISEIYENSLFYIHALVTTPPKKKGCFSGFIGGIRKLFGKEKPVEYKITTSLNVCDLTTGECKKLLDEGCEIHNVVDGKVIYSVWAPNEYNVNLHVYDIATEQVSVIEKNVRNYFATLNGYVYYTIGNDWHEPLVRNNLEGTERIEVMRNVARVVAERGGWIYVQKGYGRNAVLEKISADGKEKVVVCAQFKKLAYINETLIFYVDTANSLCSVRTDGKDQKVVSTDIDEIVAIGENSIFYSTEEQVEKNRYASCVYSVDVDGANTVKLVFDVDKIVDYDENKLYYSKSDRVRYKVTVPVSKKKDDTHYAFFNTTEYFVYDKNTRESTLILTLGLPNAKTEFKTGCFIFKKKVEGHVIFEKAPVERPFKRKGLEKAGAVNETQVQEEAAAQNVAAAAKAKLKSAGCFGKKESGKKSSKNGKGGCAVVKGAGCVFSVLAAIPIIGILFKPFAGKKGKKK